MFLYALFSHGVDIPRHIHEEFGLILGRLDIAHIEYPHLAHTAFVGLAHLLIEQVGAECAKPEIVVRTAPVRHVIVHAVASLAGLLGLGGEVADEAVIVVAPHQSHILRHFKAGMIYIENLLIRYENLRHGGNILVYIAGNHIALVGYGLGKHVFLLLYGLSAFHGAVVHASHAEGIYNLLIGHVAHTLFPERHHTVAVVHIVVFALATALPFYGRARRHRLAM